MLAPSVESPARHRAPAETHSDTLTSARHKETLFTAQQTWLSSTSRFHATSCDTTQSFFSPVCPVLQLEEILCAKLYKCNMVTSDWIVQMCHGFVLVWAHDSDVMVYISPPSHRQISLTAPRDLRLLISRKSHKNMSKMICFSLTWTWTHHHHLLHFSQGREPFRYSEATSNCHQRPLGTSHLICPHFHKHLTPTDACRTSCPAAENKTNKLIWKFWDHFIYWKDPHIFMKYIYIFSMFIFVLLWY